MGMHLERLVKKMEEGKIVCGVCVSLNDPAVSELVGMAGYDFVWIEGEHGAMGRTEMQNLMIGAHAGGAAAMIRLPYTDAALVRPVMDMGPDIIGFPFINTAEEAKKAVAACTYPPKGVRGWNPQRAGHYGQMGQSAYVDKADRETLKMMIVEQEEGFHNIEEIVKVDGVDLIVLGPGDLSVGMGLKGKQDDPCIAEMMNHAASVCVSCRKPFLAWPSMTEQSLREWEQKGASLFGFPQDSFFISQAIMKLWPEYEKAIPSKKRTR